AAANEVARCLLKLDGSLGGPAMVCGGRELMVGDLVMVADDASDRVDVDGVRLPPVGVLGTVAVLDHDRGEVEIDFSIAGVQRIAAEGPAASAITYGYAELAQRPSAPLIDLRLLPPLPDLSIGTVEGSDVEIELVP
ncbi:MAG: hypothetical protein ABI658_31225, partial [Acidimicrobiales bacterium]